MRKPVNKRIILFLALFTAIAVLLAVFSTNVASKEAIAPKAAPKQALAAPVEEITPEVELSPLGPVLTPVCACESLGDPYAEPIHYDENGEVLENVGNIGICQINRGTWYEKGLELGFDIYKEEGNRQMALWIYENNGLAPWRPWSGHCWGKVVDNLVNE